MLQLKRHASPQSHLVPIMKMTLHNDIRQSNFLNIHYGTKQNCALLDFFDSRSSKILLNSVHILIFVDVILNKM